MPFAFNPNLTLVGLLRIHELNRERTGPCTDSSRKETH
jgi:hypothetical protein